MVGRAAANLILISIACAALALAVPAALAQPAATAPPASSPATTAATTTRSATAQASTRPIAVDHSSPKLALRSFAMALDAGDRAAVLELLQADTPHERKLAGAAADLAGATADLRRAAVTAFGEQTSRALGVDPAAAVESVARIDKATESLDKEKGRAEVRTAELEGPPLVLLRDADGRWRLPVSELVKDVQAADVDRTVADMARQTKLMRDLADEVSRGAYATASAARQALDKRILQDAMPQLGPATTPAPAAAAAAATAPARPGAMKP